MNKLIILFAAITATSVLADNKQPDTLNRAAKCALNRSYIKDAYPDPNPSTSEDTYKTDPVVWVTIETSKNVMFKTFGAFNMELTETGSKKALWLGMTFPINSISSEDSEKFQLWGYTSTGSEVDLITVGKDTITVNPDYSRPMGYILNEGKPTPMTCIVWQ